MYNISERKEKAQEVFKGKNEKAANILLFFDFLFNKKSTWGRIIILMLAVAYVVIIKIFGSNASDCSSSSCPLLFFWK